MSSAIPSRCSLENMSFCSVPTCPTRGTPNTALDFKSEPTTPKSYEDANSNLDDFEFEKSQCFEYSLDDQQQEKLKQHIECGESLSTMTFADELFCNGNVLPLKLPPRLQNNKFCGQSPTPSSPKSPPSSAIKIPFGNRNLWNDDFDPFLVALENVKEEKRERAQGTITKCTWPLSPFWAASPRWPNDYQQNKQLGPQQSRTNPNELKEPNGSLYSIWVPYQNKKMGPQEPPKKVGQSLKKLAEPKGVETGGRVTRERKRQRIKKILFRSASSLEKVNCNEEKQRDETAMKCMGSTQCNENRRVSEVTNRTTLVQYRPKLFLCLGYGGN